jgi:hypothetical protein
VAAYTTTETSIAGNVPTWQHGFGGLSVDLTTGLWFMDATLIWRSSTTSTVFIKWTYFTGTITDGNYNLIRCPNNQYPIAHMSAWGDSVADAQSANTTMIDRWRIQLNVATAGSLQLSVANTSGQTNNLWRGSLLQGTKVA